MPLHPAVVHLPLGLALVVPLLALGLLIAGWRKLLPVQAFAVVVALQGVILLGGFAAYVTGGDDQRQVEKKVPEKHLLAHEEAAELFLWGQALALIFSVGTLVARGKATRVAPVLAMLASLGVAGLALRVGHRGGELVYGHGAAEVFLDFAAPRGSLP